MRIQGFIGKSRGKIRVGDRSNLREKVKLKKVCVQLNNYMNVS